MLPEILVFLLSLATVQRSSASPPLKLTRPRVAFWCGKVNQHVSLLDGDWRTDNDGISGCYDHTDKFSIVQYCRKMYPFLTITDAHKDSKTFIRGWCERGNVNCNHDSSKTTFLCIGNPVEADRLEVPNGCRFSHLYEQHHCKLENQWIQAASDQCDKTGEDLNSHGMLVPCGFNAHRGVEFVCCPRQSTPDDMPELTVMPTDDELEVIVTSPPEPEPVPDMSDPLKTVEITRHPIIHHVLEGDECSRRVIHSEYKHQREEADVKERQRISAIVAQYNREKEAADHLRETRPHAAKHMMSKVRHQAKVKLEAVGRNITQRHHALKKGYKDKLTSCYEQKLCLAIKMFKAVLSENRQEARKIVHDITTLVRNQGTTKLDNVEMKTRIYETGSEAAQSAMKHHEHHLQDDYNFTRAFMLVATKMLHGVDVLIPDCPLSETPEQETPIPDISSITEPVEKVTKVPEISKPSSSIPDISLILEPGPVIFGQEKTDKQATMKPTFVQLETEETEPPQETEQPVAKETEQPIGEKTEQPETVFKDTSEAAVRVEQPHPEEHNNQHHTGNHNHLVDDPHVVPVKDKKVEPHKVDISHKRPVFVGGVHRNSIDNKERVDSRGKPNRSYVGVAVGLAAAAAVLAVAFMVAYTIKKRYFGEQRVESSLADDQRSIHDMEADLQHHGFVNPTYKLFDEMEDKDE